MKLYELTAEYQSLQRAAEDGEDVGDQLAKLGGEIEAKGSGIVAVVKALDADAAAIKAEEKTLATRRKAIENNAERLREHVRTVMLAHGVASIKSPQCSITLSDGPEKVVVENEALIPEAFQRVTVATEIDKAGILKAWKEHGECVPGTKIERGTALRIR